MSRATRPPTPPALASAALVLAAVAAAAFPRSAPSPATAPTPAAATTSPAADDRAAPATLPADVWVGDAKPDADGLLVHEVRSPFQAGTTTVRVLLPTRLTAGRSYSTVYLLSVEARDGRRYGDGLLEAKRAGLADRHDAVFVAPTFSHLPWYADHPTDPTIRQETYFTEVVVPLVERRYPVRRAAAGRLLVGFSKSGWGAFALLLRHPDQFGRAAAWDAPLMMDAPGKYGSGDVFGDRATFDRYRVDRLLEQRAADLRPPPAAADPATAPGPATATRPAVPRLFLLGYGNFRDEHRRAHERMEQLKVPHRYADGPPRKHDWSSGWLPEAVAGVLTADGDK